MFNQDLFQILIDWLLSQGIRIALILVAAYLAGMVGRRFIKRIVAQGVKNGSKEAIEKRQKTLVSIFSGVLKVSIWAVALMMIVSELGINIGPVLAGAGILGVAVGFGAQYVIRDFLAGLFIIIENQYRIGDVVCLDGTCGLVEDIDLRKTVLRDLDGTIHYIPNGEVKKTSNSSKQFSRINLDIGVSYQADLDKVAEVINQVGNELAEDAAWKDSITKAPQFLRVNDFADSAIIIKILGETKPLKQWEVTGELRRRIKKAFDQEGIEIPFPQVSLWLKGKSGSDSSLK
jgi:moderate conductance mechanosensitive channel